MRRFAAFLVVSSLCVAGCAVDDDTTETSGGDTGRGDGVSLDASPGEDSSVDSTTPDTAIEEDSSVPDTGVADTADASVPEVFVDTGFPFDTFIDTMVPDTFVPPACVTAADCPFSDLECAKKTCIGGKCGVNFIAKGTLTGPQTDSDCKRRECDGAGLAVIAYDPTDPPKDTDQCLKEYCDGAVAKFDPQPLGFPCSTSLGTKCDGAGKCVQCVTAADCPGSDNPCSARSCTSGTCGLVTIADGMPALVDDAKADCSKLMCNVGGSITSTSSPTYHNYDTSDLPPVLPDHSCWVPSCFDGPGYTNKPYGTPCDGGKTCGGYPGEYDNGVCGECDTDDDCWGVVSAGVCNPPKCSAHVCSSGPYLPAGTPCNNDGCSSTCVAEGSTTYCPYTCD